MMCPHPPLEIIDFLVMGDHTLRMHFALKLNARPVAVLIVYKHVHVVIGFAVKIVGYEVCMGPETRIPRSNNRAGDHHGLVASTYLIILLVPPCVPGPGLGSQHACSFRSLLVATDWLSDICYLLLVNLG